MFKKRFSVSLSKKIGKFNKIIKVDSDKSISIRAFLISAISQNISEIKNVLESEDVLSCINCLRKLGVNIKKIKSKHYIIYGKGLGSLYIKNNSTLNFGNSGTLARLLIGILSTTPNIKVKIEGDQSLNKRNMSKLIDITNQFGAEFYPKNKNHFPLTMVSSNMPVCINYKAGVSAQLKSAVILAGLNSYGTTNILELDASRNHTENIILASKKVIDVKIFKKGFKKIKIFGKKNLSPIKLSIPSDPSSAAFITALTILNKNSKVQIKNVCLNTTRIGFYEILKKHGAKIVFKNIKKKNNETVGDIFVSSGKIKPIKADSKFYVKATDEYPVMFIIAALTKGISIFKGINDLKNKESNRIKEVQKILSQIGIKTTFNKNQIKIYGKIIDDIKNKKINVPNLGDHRICMSVSILSLLTGIRSNIKNFETVYTSSPQFLKTIKFLGGKFEIKKLS